ncbi:MAG: YceI family protein, partial [Bacteroidota bacterium]
MTPSDRHLPGWAWPGVAGLLFVLACTVPAIGQSTDVSVVATAGEKTLLFTESGTASFTSSVPLHSFTGRSDHLTGMIDLEENIVDFYLDLSTQETGLRRRDRDMRRTLEVEQYPFAEFTGQLTERFDPNRSESQPVTAVGEFTIHGVTQSVEIQGVLTPMEGGVRLQAEWTLRLESYGIEPPGLLFYRVQQEQDVEIQATLQAVDELP